MQQAAAMQIAAMNKRQCYEALAQAMVESPDLAPRIAANVAAITMDAKTLVTF